MDPGPMTTAKGASWKLADGIAPLTQGLAVTGFGFLPYGWALFLEILEPAGGGWLKDLERVAPVTSAVPPPQSAALSQATAIAFTWTGLQRMALAETALASFARPFQEGMMQEDRLRRLGDRRRGAWCDPVIPGGPRWSANTPPRQTDEAVGAYDVKRETAEQAVTTAISVHAVVLLYAQDAESANALAATVEQVLKPHRVAVVHRLELLLGVDPGPVNREHFGFADGLSQPAPFDTEGAVLLAGRQVVERDKVQGVPLGDFLIGYQNSHHEKSPGPVVPDRVQGRADVQPSQAGLVPHREAQSFFDFGRNGSYVVIRELKQDVAAFWQSMHADAAAIQARESKAQHVTPTWLAERIVGRTLDGHLLRPDDQALPPVQGMPDNDYLFLKDDPHGYGCPLGSHVRRAHPRDALAPTPADGKSLLAAANNHRILRRGRKFGPKIADDRTDDAQERGLLFMCLNTDIARQFEFIQQTWLLNSNFATLYDEVDPLVGPDGRMTIQEQPLRRTIDVKTYVQMAGGDYFFLPSLPALAYLAML